MRRILFLAMTLCLVSCWQDDNSKPTRIMEEGLPFNRVTEFKYKKHSYIKFQDGTLGGVVHDPECEECYAKFD